MSLAKLRTQILNTIFPSFCVGCGKVNQQLCKFCAVNRLDWIYEHRCHICFQTTHRQLIHTECKEYTYLDGVVCCINYNKLAKQMLHQYKYQFRRDLALTFTKLIKLKLGEYPYITPDFIFTFVPCHAFKYKWRGFNQVEEFAREISACNSLLKRIVNTKAQSGLDRAERMANLSEAFCVRPEADVKDKSIVIFDDIFTSGATLEVCAKVLKAAGAREVIGVTLIRD